MRHLGAAAKRAFGGAGETGIAVVSGAGAALLVRKATENIETLRTHWWATPLAMAVGGHFAKKMNHTVGTSIAAVGGAVAYENWTGQRVNASGLIMPGQAGDVRMGGAEAGDVALESGAYEPLRFSDNAATSAGAPSAGALNEPGSDGFISQIGEAGAVYSEAYGLRD